jgi:hypothetical protein
LAPILVAAYLWLFSAISRSIKSTIFFAWKKITVKFQQLRSVSSRKKEIQTLTLTIFPTETEEIAEETEPTEEPAEDDSSDNGDNCDNGDDNPPEEPNPRTIVPLFPNFFCYLE